MYTIGEVAQMFDLPISTLRYYDKEGLFPSLKREGGIRKFSDNELEALRVIECLKKSGLEIKDIKLFMTWCKEGPITYPNRLDLLQKQKEHVEEQIKQLHKALDMLTYKCWFYEEIIKEGDEDKVRSSIPNNLPKEIKDAYLNAHK